MGILKKMIAISRTELILRDHHIDVPAYSHLYGAKLIMQLYTDIPISTPPGKRQKSILRAFILILFLALQ